MVSDFESGVRETGRRLYNLIEGETPSVFNKDYWMGKVIEWSMKHEDFKVQMFRFIDVFPYLTRPESVPKHLAEYFGGTELDFPKALRLGVTSLSHTSIGAKRIAKTIANNIEAMGKNFIAGATPQEALPVLEGLRSKGIAFSVDLLGEAVVS